jgi:hypothetical protein
MGSRGELLPIHAHLRHYRPCYDPVHSREASPRVHRRLKRAYLFRNALLEFLDSPRQFVPPPYPLFAEEPVMFANVSRGGLLEERNLSA